MNKYKQLFINTVTFAMGSFGSKLITFLLLSLYTRVLTTAENGTVENLVQAANVLIPIATLSMADGVIRFGLDKQYSKADVFSVGFTTALMGLGGVLVLFPLIGFVDFLSSYAVLLYVYVFVACIKLVCAQFVRARGLVRLFAIDGFLDTLVMVLLNILFLVVLKWGVTGYILSILLADLFSIGFLFVVADLKRYLRFKDIPKGLRKAMLTYSIPLIPTTIMWWVTSVSNRFIITQMMGEGYNGLYSIANKIPTLVTIISGFFAQAWQMSAITESESRSRAQFFTTVFRTFQSVVFLAAGGILLFIRPVTAFMYDKAYLDTYRITPFMVLGVVFSCFVTFLGSVYVAEKRSKRSLATTSVGAIANIVLNIVLIPQWGLQGAAFATFISYASVFLIRAVDTKRFIGMKLGWQRLMGNVLMLSTMGAYVYAWPRFTTPILILLFGLLCWLNIVPVLRAAVALLRSRRAKARA